MLKRKCSFCPNQVVVKTIEFRNTELQLLRVACPKCGPYSFYELYVPRFSLRFPQFQFCTRCGTTLDLTLEHVKDTAICLGNHYTRIECQVCYYLNPIYLIWRI